MNIVVLVKQVPDPESIVAVAGNGTKLDIEQKFALNLFDEFAIEEALRIKEKHTGKVKVITMGGGKAIDALRTGIAMGADEAFLLEDAEFLDGDGYSTAFALSKAISKDPFDIILCGKQAIDHDRGEVGQMVAQFLDLPHVGSILKLDISAGVAIAECAIEGGKETVEVKLPAVFTTQKGLNEPRVPLITGVMKAMKVQVPRLKPSDIGVSSQEIGIKGSKVKIEKYLPPKKRPPMQIISGEPQQAAVEAVRILMEVERVL